MSDELSYEQMMELLTSMRAQFDQFLPWTRPMFAMAKEIESTALAEGLSEQTASAITLQAMANMNMFPFIGDIHE